MSTENCETIIATEGNKDKDDLEKDFMDGGNEEGGQMSSTKFKFNTNTYATTKSLIAGVMDVALLTSNASQIKLIAKANSWTTFNISVVTLLSLSIILQMILVICVVIMATSKADLHLIEESNKDHEEEKRKIDRINKAVLGISVIVTFINVVTATFVGETISVA